MTDAELLQHYIQCKLSSTGRSAVPATIVS
jgi:hypothetical protein